MQDETTADSDADPHLNLLLGLPLGDDPGTDQEIPDGVPLIALQLDDLSKVGLGLASGDDGFRSIGTEFGFFARDDVAVACEFLRARVEARQGKAR